jgi:Lon protease-like protein
MGDEIALFPLSNVVLFPRVRAPLHIFEPRYRHMVSDVIDAHGMIAMALFQGNVAAPNSARGVPPLRPFVCIGQIREYERMADGRYVLMLQGLCRARIEEEISHLPYRLVRALPVEENTPEESQLAHYRRRLDDLLHQTFAPGVADRTRRRQQDYAGVSTPVVVDLAIAAVCRVVTQQYRLLATPDVRQRAEWVIRQMEILVGRHPDANSLN